MTQPCFAVITLGSNSFNMLVAQEIDGRIEQIAKYKQKVRLAEGISADLSLSDVVAKRGLDCLAWFNSKLIEHGIPAERTRVLATATLRQISNKDDFCKLALTYLPVPVVIISGEQEAEFIFLGSGITDSADHAVLDIGGASTEIIIGNNHQIKHLVSLDFGSVQINRSYQADFKIITEQAYQTVKQQISLHINQQAPWLKQHLGLVCVGRSGAIQSVIEVMQAQNLGNKITDDILKRLNSQVIGQNWMTPEVEGLSLERQPTYCAALMQLTALIELLKFEHIALSKGALREGLLANWQRI
ncbi:exopolyphosphatase [Paraferrimonas sp. SM1919]|uniref:Ppx/GppA phosphatase family protein n=1 Tax=Paraferrimonas sp. SM1919 TaxID=2662263 RepID=UPI0013D5A4A5|nr:exopolyphosphatase [Paraferrimonas sp. SM1919]